MSQGTTSSSSMCSASTPGADIDDPACIDSGGSIAQALVEPSPPTSNLICTRCNKTLKTRQNLIKHKALHVQKDFMKTVNRRQLNFGGDIALIVLREMLEVDPIGEDMKNYVISLLSKSDDAAWVNFVTICCDYIVDIVFQKTNVLPQVQHERNLKDMNKWLSNRQERTQLFSNISLVVEGSESVIQPVVYRFCTKMYEKLEIEYLRLARKEIFGDTAPSEPELSLEIAEEQTLYYACGSVVRFFLAKSKKKRNVEGSQYVKARKKCLQEKFLFVEGEHYSDEFMKVKEWFDKVDRGGLIAINEGLYYFFLNIEYLIRKCFTGIELKHETVVDEMFHLGNNYLTEYWCSITNSYMSEENSLLFLDSVVKRFVQFSGKAEAGLRRRQVERTKEMKTVALRTCLKRN